MSLSNWFDSLIFSSEAIGSVDKVAYKYTVRSKIIQKKKNIYKYRELIYSYHAPKAKIPCVYVLEEVAWFNFDFAPLPLVLLININNFDKNRFSLLLSILI